MSPQMQPDYLTRVRWRGSGKEPGLPGYLHDKVKGEQFVRSLGVDSPRVYSRFGSVDEITFQGLPDAFVLKPTFLSSSLGVMVLRRQGDVYVDSLWGKTYTLEEVRQEQVRLAEKSQAENKAWIAEELVEDVTGSLVPDDWKFYCFQGRIGLIHRVVRAEPRVRHAYFDGDFVPLADERGEFICVNEKLIERISVAPPVEWKSLMNAARRISVAVPTPFVRVDMYNSTRGPLFGEFTLVPGTFYYEDRERMMPPLSVRLGQLWQQAEIDLT